jgi:hypothetical protein
MNPTPIRAFGPVSADQMWPGRNIGATPAASVDLRKERRVKRVLEFMEYASWQMEYPATNGKLDARSPAHLLPADAAAALRVLHSQELPRSSRFTCSPAHLLTRASSGTKHKTTLMTRSQFHD